MVLILDLSLIVLILVLSLMVLIFVVTLMVQILCSDFHLSDVELSLIVLRVSLILLSH